MDIRPPLDGLRAPASRRRSLHSERFSSHILSRSELRELIRSWRARLRIGLLPASVAARLFGSLSLCPPRIVDTPCSIPRGERVRRPSATTDLSTPPKRPARSSNVLRGFPHSISLQEPAAALVMDKLVTHGACPELVLNPRCAATVVGRPDCLPRGADRRTRRSSPHPARLATLEDRGRFCVCRLPQPWAYNSAQSTRSLLELPQNSRRCFYVRPDVLRLHDRKTSAVTTPRQADLLPPRSALDPLLKRLRRLIRILSRSGRLLSFRGSLFEHRVER